MEGSSQIPLKVHQAPPKGTVETVVTMGTVAMVVIMEPKGENHKMELEVGLEGITTKVPLNSMSTTLHLWVVVSAFWVTTLSVFKPLRDQPIQVHPLPLTAVRIKHAPRYLTLRTGTALADTLTNSTLSKSVLLTRRFVATTTPSTSRTQVTLQMLTLLVFQLEKHVSSQSLLNVVLLQFNLEMCLMLPFSTCNTKLQR